jgi:hypothetical protein
MLPVGTLSRLKRPSKSLIVPLIVPLVSDLITITLAPIKLSPLEASVIVPLTVRVCAVSPPHPRRRVTKKIY